MKKLIFIFTFIAMGFASSDATADQCRSQLRKGNGDVIRRFMSNAPRKFLACSRAYLKCRRELTTRHLDGRNPYAYCTVGRALRPHRPRRDWLRRRCTADLRTFRGRRITSVRASVEGIVGTGLKRRACKKAMRKCRRKKARLGRRRAYCMVRR
ncbi:MAG: hypothetical protein HOE90_17820 [Bacteriovoracaceae bacterium]|jgi:hypothetical protein|nr:hypothetical protein [Bacteriovoracaceae bacterium]